MSDTGTARLSVRVPVSALERLDGLASERGLSRSGALRALLEGAGPAPVAADGEEALVLLSESARAGSVPARIALVRLLSKPAAAVDPVQAEIDELARRRRAKEQ